MKMKNFNFKPSIATVSETLGNSGDYVTEFENIIPEDSYLNGEDLLSGLGVDRLFSELFSMVSSHTGEVVSFFLLLLGIGLFSAFADIKKVGTKQACAIAYFYSDCFCLIPTLDSRIHCREDGICSPREAAFKPPLWR